MLMKLFSIFISVIYSGSIEKSHSYCLIYSSSFILSPKPKFTEDRVR